MKNAVRGPFALQLANNNAIIGYILTVKGVLTMVSSSLELRFPPGRTYSSTSRAASVDRPVIVRCSRGGPVVLGRLLDLREDEVEPLDHKVRINARPMRDRQRHPNHGSTELGCNERSRAAAD